MRRRTFSRFTVLGPPDSYILAMLPNAMVPPSASLWLAFSDPRCLLDTRFAFVQQIERAHAFQYFGDDCAIHGRLDIVVHLTDIQAILGQLKTIELDTQLGNDKLGVSITRSVVPGTACMRDLISSAF